MTVLSPIRNLPPAISLTGAEEIPLDQAGTTKRATVQQVSQAFIVPFPAEIAWVIDGSNSVIQTDVYGYIQVPFPCTITSAQLLADAAGTISIDIWKCTVDDFDAGVTHPVAADTITGGVPLTLSGTSKVTNSALAGWTTSLAAGDVLAYSVGAGVAGITRITTSLFTSRVLT